MPFSPTHTNQPWLWSAGVCLGSSPSTYWRLQGSHKKQTPHLVQRKHQMASCVQCGTNIHLWSWEILNSTAVSLLPGHQLLHCLSGTKHLPLESFTFLKTACPQFSSCHQWKWKMTAIRVLPPFFFFFCNVSNNTLLEGAGNWYQLNIWRGKKKKRTNLSAKYMLCCFLSFLKTSSTEKEEVRAMESRGQAEGVCSGRSGLQLAQQPPPSSQWLWHTWELSGSRDLSGSLWISCFTVLCSVTPYI